MTDPLLNNLAVLFQHSQSPDAAPRKHAEDKLREFQMQPNFSLIALQFLQVGNFEPSIKLSCAIFFKNHIKSHWKEREEDAIVISQQEREQIKANIIRLSLVSPDFISRLLNEAIAIMAHSDFPESWNSLLPELLQLAAVDQANDNLLTGILTIIHMVLKKYRFRYKSQDVLRELAAILQAFQQPYLELFLATARRALAPESPPHVVKAAFTNFHLLVKIFFSMCWVDIPEFFEDHCADWFNTFHQFYNYQTTNPELLGAKSKAGILFSLQSSMTKSMVLFIEKYEEEFKDFLPTALQDIWSLLSRTSIDDKYDSLAISALNFMTQVSKSVYYQLFSDPEGATLRKICENIVIPNIQFRDSDEESFSGTPVDYVRRDIEGSDTATRRRAVIELVKGLRVHFEKQITPIFSAYVEAMLQQYAKDPKNFWKAKDASISLVTALTVTATTRAEGTVEINELVPIVPFYNSQVLPELANPKTPPVLQADCLKFVYVFRKQLGKEAGLQLLPVLIALLGSSEYVVNTYAALCIERSFGARDFTKQQLKPHLQPLINALFNILGHVESKENEYIMKAIMRTISTSQEEIGPYAGLLLAALGTLLSAVAKNPNNPQFNHYLFECVGGLIKTVLTADSGAHPALENAILPTFTFILAEDIVEFLPYVFQILSLMLELAPQTQNPFYMTIFAPLLRPNLWGRPGNVTPLTLLLCAFLKQDVRRLLSANQLNPLVGLFRKLAENKKHDREVFLLLQALFEFVPLADLGVYLRDIFISCFTRLSTKKTPFFVWNFLTAVGLFMGKHGPNPLIDIVTSIQPNLFLSLLNSLVIGEATKIGPDLDRKKLAIGLTRLLVEAPRMFEAPYYPDTWAGVLKTLVLLIEKEPAGSPDDYGGDDDAGFSNYSELHFASIPERDPFANIDPRAALQQSLLQLTAARPTMQVALTLFSAQVPAEDLQKYFNNTIVKFT